MKKINLAAFLAVVGLFISVGFVSTAAAVPTIVSSPRTVQAGSLHPCRNWDHTQLTTAKLQAALRQYPQCLAYWGKMTNSPGAKPEDFVYVGPGKQVRPGQYIINSGIDGNANPRYMKYKVKPGDHLCALRNMRTGVEGSSKCDCLNGANVAPKKVVQHLPRMVTLRAWASAEATSSANVRVRMKFNCPGSQTTVTVTVRVYAHSAAQAQAIARAEQARANSGHPSAKVWAKAVATARTSTSISIKVNCSKPPVPVPIPPTPTAKLLILKKTILNGQETLSSGGTFGFQLDGVRNFVLSADGVTRNLGDFSVGSSHTVCETNSLGWTPDQGCITVRLPAGGFTMVFVNRLTTVQPPSPQPPPVTCPSGQILENGVCVTPKGDASPSTPPIALGPNPTNTPDSPSGTRPSDGGTPGGGLTPCPPGYSGTYPDCIPL